MRYTFHLSRLEGLLQTVRGQHPLRKGESIEPENSIVDEVRNRLENCTYERIPQLSLLFNTKRLIACIDIVSIDREGDIAEKAAYAAKLKPRDQMLLRAWFKLVKTYPNPLLEQLLKELIQNQGFSVLENHPKISTRLPSWFLASELPIGIIRDYRTTEENIRIDEFLSEQFFTWDDSLYRFIWVALLTKGTQRDLKRQNHKRILDIIKTQLQSAVRIQICQYYLNTLNSLNNWHEEMLNYINHEWGKPGRVESDNKNDHRFWHNVKNQAKEEFRRWLISREVVSFFDGERAKFWRDYVDAAKVKDVQKILGGDGFMLDFGRFGVIEFKNVGNAAYIYPQETFKRFWKGASFWTNSPIYFKEQTKTIRAKELQGWDGRIVHPAGWQDRAKYRIDVLMAQK